MVIVGYSTFPLAHVTPVTTIETLKITNPIPSLDPDHPDYDDVLLSAIGHLQLPALDFGTVYLLTSGLPRHSQHFVKR